MFSLEQLTFFDVFGFLLWRKAFSPAEIERISVQFREVLDYDRHGGEFPGDKRHSFNGLLEQREDMYWLAEDDRIFCTVEQLLGPDFVWIGSDGSMYVGDTRWHADNSDGRYRRVKVAFYLNPVGTETGCLRVIPGSHAPGLSDQLMFAMAFQ